MGAGTGILSLFCYRAGAKRVYAVEASPLATVLEEIVKANKADDVIKVIPKKVEEVELDEKVDIMVSEWMGFYLLHESMLNSVVIARDKHLNEETGICLPSHATIFSAACDYKDPFWHDVYGFNMEPMDKMVRKQATKPAVLNLPASSIISEPQVLAEFDLRWVTEEELAQVQGRSFVSIKKEAHLQGLAIWFDCKFDPWTENGEWQKPVTLSTAPNSPSTHWKQTLVMLPSANILMVEADEIVGWEMFMGQDPTNPRFYTIALGMLDPEEDEHPVPCACQMAKCVLIQALLQREEEALTQGDT